MTILEWFAVGTTCLCGAAAWWQSRPRQEPKVVALVVSQAGRDQALLRLIREARSSVSLRTESLALVPAGNELVQAIQRKVTVSVGLPLASGSSAKGSRLPRLLMKQGAFVTFSGDSAASDRGTFLVVDGERFLYSAMPLTISAPGSRVAYVSGPLGR